MPAVLQHRPEGEHVHTVSVSVLFHPDHPLPAPQGVCLRTDYRDGSFIVDEVGDDLIMTPDEADKLADVLRSFAAVARAATAEALDHIESPLIPLIREKL